MSQFERYTNAEYVEAMRIFLDISRRNFMKESGFAAQRSSEFGRLPKYADAPLQALEAQVNAKSARAEASDTSFGERLTLARDYQAMSDSDIAAALGVSREIVRRWRDNKNQSTRHAELAQFLCVPYDWLVYGGEEHLPANSHLGVRVGYVYYDEKDKKKVTHVGEAAQYREQLYALTQAVFAEVSDDATESYIRAYLEWAVFNRFELAQAARRAGGRWTVVSGRWLFSPWVPLEKRGLTRRYFSDQVEGIIEEELATQPTVFAAWDALDNRCRALGLSPDDYPSRITLHKRVERDRELAKKFGVDLNDLIATSVAEHASEDSAESTDQSETVEGNASDTAEA